MNASESGKYRLVFVTNQLKTLFFVALGKVLAQQGCHIGWIATSKRWGDHLRASGWDDCDILDVWKLGPVWIKGAPLSVDQNEILGRAEKAGRYSVNNMILMDRELRLKPPAVARAYVGVLAQAMDGFFAAFKPDMVVGEATWCVETVAAHIARLHGASMVFPHTLRLPSERLVLIDDIGPNPFLTWCEVGPEAKILAKKTVENQNSGSSQPYYMNVIHSPVRWKSHWLEELKIALGSSALNRFDVSVPALPARMARRCRTAWNALLTRMFVRFDDGKAKASTPYVFVTLHMQPEASVDNWGSPFANQYETIAALARIVPANMEILVKEHRAAIGCRSLAYYRALQRLPGVRLVNPNAHTPTLMRGARLVASPSGTACLEAAVMGIPAVSFGHVSFGSALLQQGFDPYGLSLAEMTAFMQQADRLRGSGELAARALAYLELAIANSVEAREGDPMGDPQTVAPDNLAPLAEFLLSACRHLQQNRSS